MDINDILSKVSIWALPVLFAITLHEVAHGWVAKKLGDTTAFMMGRLTLNPLKHIDPIGTILVPLVLLVLGGFIFGWAKPVPVNTRNLRNPHRDMAIVAIAGPLSNLAMAIAWAVLWKIGEFFTGSGNDFFGTPLMLMGYAGVVINLILAVLNMLPLPPLDGGRVLSGLLPPRLSDQFNRIEPFGFFILIGLMIFGILSQILSPIINFFFTLLDQLFSFSAIPMA